MRGICATSRPKPHEFGERVRQRKCHNPRLQKKKKLHDVFLWGKIGFAINAEDLNPTKDWTVRDQKSLP